jgi:hypothetical protein
MNRLSDGLIGHRIGVRSNNDRAVSSHRIVNQLLIFIDRSAIVSYRQIWRKDGI